MKFTVNGESWSIVFVMPDDSILVRSDGSLAYAVTDDTYRTVFISQGISGAFLDKVICHELCHVHSFAYNLDIPIDVEEQIADFLATYGRNVFRIADELFRMIRKIA